VANPGCAIKPGMLIRATFAVGDLHPALLVPKDALVLSALGQSVYVLRQGKAYPVPVRVVASHDSLVEVQGDLKAGQQVVTIGNERLFPGQPVKVIKR
jgi:multidrug efflux pump subunit AcrA (membrane-fusion protein)